MRNEEGSDSDRYLTARGREQTAEVAELMRAHGFVPTHVYSSTLVRAVQTAEIVAHELGYSGVVIARPALIPEASAMRAASVLDAHGGNDVVLLVSHEPLVSALAGRLSSMGDTFPGFATSGVAIIDDGALTGRIDPDALIIRDASDLS